MNLSTMLVLGVAFLLGSIPSGLVVFRFARGVDIRARGSKNIGASNVFREGGPRLGAATLALDAAKGAVAVVVARLSLPAEPFVHECAALAAVLGHVFSPWLQFRGGKGVATAAGAFLLLHPAAVLVATSIFAVLAFGTGHASVGSVVAAPIFALGVAISDAGPRAALVAALLAVLILWTHRENMARLLRGEEPPLNPPS